MSLPSRAAAAAAILELLDQRSPTSTICPSEAARRLAPDWRPLMPLVRDAAGDLVDKGLARVTRSGVEVDPRRALGPIRIGRISS